MFNKLKKDKITDMANERERDLVLAPNQYAYISDQTKGHIVAYVGPFKTSMANTDQPVYFDNNKKKFVNCVLDEAIKAFTIVPEGWYAALKNPAVDGIQPNHGTANNQPKLNIGRKVNLQGPDFFALWPGQLVKVLRGHRLRSNQYLIVRVYEEEQAKKNWNKAVIMPQKADNEKANPEIKKETELPNLAVGKLLVIKGTEVSFYIPPTGLEVVPDANEEYVRNAITLERLEYCILLDENGNKRYIQGPDVVFPNPTEHFYEKNGYTKFRAIELSENTGMHVKVISPYKESDVTYNIGDELFLTGKELKIYYPRVEHAIIKYGDQEIYQAVAIPPGEGRYFLNRNTGQITLKKGPCMFLPDPRESVIVQRILSEKQANLWYPGNREVIDYNARLRDVARYEKMNEYLTQKEVEKYFTPQLEKSVDKKVSREIASDEFLRSNSVTKAKSITLDTKFQGAVTIDIWTGYALLITSKSGNRKVIVGPQTYQLEYDEDIAVIEFSTGTPKSDKNLTRTVFLRVLYNKVSDLIEVESKDLCPVQVSLSYRVNFTGEPEKWFNVENYVKFLCENMKSRIRNTVKKLSIIDFYANAIDILRDAVLGKTDENGQRNSGKFEENGMQVYDLEILDINILDEEVEKLLFATEHEEMKRKLMLVAKQNEFNFTHDNEGLTRKILNEKSLTKREEVDLKIKEIQKDLLFALTNLELEINTQQRQLEVQLQRQDTLNQINDNELARRKATEELQLQIAREKIEHRLVEINAEANTIIEKAKAISPDLIAALQGFADKALAEKMAQSMAPLSIIGGKSIAEVFANLLKGTVLEHVIKKAE